MTTNTSANTPITPLICAVLVAASIIVVHLFIRPIMPIDETRYISVAWEMWQNGNWLVPHENGLPYAHKPPMMFWLINLIWSIVGVSEWSARSIIPFCSLANFVLLFQLAKALFPEDGKTISLAPVVLLTLAGWLFYLPTTMFDLLLSVFVLGFCLALVHGSNMPKPRYWLLAGLMFGMGLLTKGPVMLVYTLPFILLYPLWRRQQSISAKRFAGYCTLAISLGIAVMMMWVLPAIHIGGTAYENELLWKQTSGRMVNSFAHARPFYWYLMLIPALLMPLPLLRSFWRGLIQPQARIDKALLILLCSVVLIFSLISGKQIHYLVPLFPFTALLVAHKLPKQPMREWYLTALLGVIALATLTMPLWLHTAFKSVEQPHSWYWLGLLPLALSSLPLMKHWSTPTQTLTAQFLLLPVALTTLFSAMAPVFHRAYNIEPLAITLAQYQQQGKTLVSWDRYHNQFGFLGRLQQPLIDLTEQPQAKLQWAAAHPNSLILFSERNPNPHWFDVALKHQVYRGRQLFIVQASDLVNEMNQLAANSVATGGSDASLNCHKDCLTLAE